MDWKHNMPRFVRLDGENNSVEWVRLESIIAVIECHKDTWTLLLLSCGHSTLVKQGFREIFGVDK